MRARAAARARASSDEGRHGSGRGRYAVYAVGVALVTFVLGYGVTALAFGTAAGPTDVELVPDVRRLTVAAAARALDDEDLAIEIGDSLPNPNEPAGTVVAQSPLPGQEVSPGTVVSVIVSTGQPRLTVPDVQSMPLALAVRALEASGFSVTTEEVDGQGRPGRVLDISPAAGSAIPLPATIHVRVGGAPPRIEMPTVIGMLEGDARSLLEEWGLEVTGVELERTRFGESGGVVGQIPAPGDSVETGSAVQLRVTETEVTEERGVTRRGEGRENR